MKKTAAILLFVSLMILTACGSGANKMEDNENKATEAQQDNPEMQQDESEDTGDETNEENVESLSTEMILRNSAEAMQNLTSMLLTGEIVTDEADGYIKDVITRQLEIEVSLNDPITMHQIHHVESETNWPMDLEIYTTPDTFYTRDTGENTWQTTPASEGSHQYFTIINADSLNRFAEHSGEFQLIEGEDHYKLSFSGTDDLFKSVRYGDADKMENSILKDDFNTMKIDGIFELTINKDNFYVTSYSITYDATTTTELGDYHAIEKAFYQLSNFDEYNEIKLPAEITQETTVEEADDQGSMTAEELLQKTTEKMGKLTSMKLVGEIVSDQTNRYQKSTINWNVEMDMNLVGEIIWHEFLSVDDGRTEPMNLELYTTPETYWVRNLDHDPDRWSQSEAFMGGYQHFNVLTPFVLEQYSKAGSQFNVIDEGDHYAVTFTGEDTEFNNLIYRGFDDIVDDVLATNYESMEISGTFEMTIDKDSFYVTSYTMEHDAKVTTTETGDYHVVEKATYLFSNFNEFDNLNIPEEIISNAVVD